MAFNQNYFFYCNKAVDPTKLSRKLFLKRLPYLLALSSFLHFSSSAQEQKVTISTFCAYSTGNLCGSKFELNFYDLSDSLWVKKIAYEVFNELGINKKVFIGRLNDKNVPGIFFKLSEDNIARVLVSQKYISQTWIALGIIFHELGHYINDHENFCSNKDLELDADYYAGYCLSKAGANKGEAIESLTILPEEGDETHPPKKDREQRVLKGWDDQKKSIGINSFTSEKEIVGWIKKEKEVTVVINDHPQYHFKRPQTFHEDSILAFDAEVGILYIKSTNSTYYFSDYPKHKYWASSLGELINNKTSLIYLRTSPGDIRIYDRGKLKFRQSKTKHKMDWVDVKHQDYYIEFDDSGTSRTIILPEFLYNRQLNKAFPAFYR